MAQIYKNGVDMDLFGSVYWIFCVSHIKADPLRTDRNLFGIGLVLVATYIAKVTVSESQYLRGGGYPLRKIVIIRMQRRFSRMIYAKNYDKLKNR